MNLRVRSLHPLLVVPVAVAAIACGSPPGSTGEDSVGQVSLAVTSVPASVQCLQIVATGSTTVTQNFTVAAGASTASLSLGELPLGNVSISGAAYTAACASIAGTQPAWVAAAVSATLLAGKPTSVALAFRPDNSVNATGTFIGNVTQVAPGDTDTMIVESDGSVRASGSSYFFTAQKTPVVLPALTNVLQVSATSQGGCAVLTSGGVECWGSNTLGQLGNGTQTSSATPVAVGGVSGAVQVSYANDYACAVTATGVLWCWGSNANGQLGNDSVGVDYLVAVNPSSLPSPVASVATGGTAGSPVTCAVLYSGATWCWGSNTWGQFGNGTTSTGSLYPVPVTNLAATKQVVIGQNTTCALRDDGTVRCWGSGGNLGTGSTAQSLVPAQVNVSGITQIAASLQTFCALSAGGIQCWGTSFYGESGDGTGSSYLSPMFVNTTAVAGATSVVGSSFGNHFCAALANQTIECWGQNSSGQLGNGTLENGFLPSAVQL